MEYVQVVSTEAILEAILVKEDNDGVGDSERSKLASLIWYEEDGLDEGNGRL